MKFSITTIAISIIILILSCNKPKTKRDVLNSLGLQQSDNNNDTLQTQRVSYASNTGQYYDVINFKGNGMRKSKVFHLQGTDSKIVFKYSSLSDQVGEFAVYVVPAGEDITKTGGFPELSSSQIDDAGESSIQKPAGDYYLEVAAAGRWSVKVQQIN